MATTSRTPRGQVTAKAERLIATGCLVALEDSADRWFGIVKGDTGTYAVEYLFGPTTWARKCQCKSHRKRGWCSHTLAVLLQRARRVGVGA